MELPYGRWSAGQGDLGAVDVCQGVASLGSSDPGLAWRWAMEAECRPGRRSVGLARLDGAGLAWRRDIGLGPHRGLGYGAGRPSAGAAR
jgi:hypothetical protein